MFLLYNDPNWYKKLSPEEMQKATEKYMAWMSKPICQRRHSSGDPGRVIRPHDGNRRATDGPYSETKEILGGSTLLRPPIYAKPSSCSLDHPHLEYGGTTEVRHVFAI